MSHVSPAAQADHPPASPAPKPVGPLTERWLSDTAVSQDLKNQWLTDGFSILQGVYSAEEVRRYNATVAGVRGSVDDGKDAYGYGDRIGQLHQKEPDLLRLAAHPDILAFLRWAFDDDPVVFGSLNFERGTQQEAHIDAIFFWPEPNYGMAGCWVALEDVDPDAGPLFYLPGSHRWPFFHSEDSVASRPDLAQRRVAARDPGMAADARALIASQIGTAWTEDLRGLERDRNVARVHPALRAGDVVFWHAMLAHGGSARLNPALSRRSVVFHYIGRRTRLYTFEQFMLFDNTDLVAQQSQAMDLRSFEGRVDYMRYPYFVTYAPGQIVHPL